MSVAGTPCWSPSPLTVDDTPSTSSSTPSRSPSLSSSAALASLPTSGPVKRLRKTTSKAKIGSGSEEGQAPASTTKTRVRPADKRGNPPRPPNAWICYRSARVHELKASSEYAKLPQADISKIIGQIWRNEPAEVRQKYEDMAAAEKAEHKEKHPDYVFRPVRRTSTKRTAKVKAAPCPPPPPMSGTVPSVLRPPPLELPTPPASCYTSPLASSYTSFDAPADLTTLPTPAFSPSDLPVPPPGPPSSHAPLPPFADDWAVYPSYSGVYTPLSPGSTPLDVSSFDCLAPSQLGYPFVPTFSHNLDHTYSFIEGSYMTPPPTAATFDEIWAAATESSDSIEAPSSFAL
ncbi:hypothetical protein JCM11251_007737 [Rhodosporidiobolus azoricus]